MSDPVSWFLIEPGWKVLDSSGDDVGSVEEIVGDSGIDIFNGLAISIGVLGGRRYVPAEVVGEITEGSVQLRLSADEVKQLGDFQEPPPSEEFVP
jgi:Uncharacterized protein conserved in bacteria (DUF2171)